MFILSRTKSICNLFYTCAYFFMCLCTFLLEAVVFSFSCFSSFFCCIGVILRSLSKFSFAAIIRNDRRSRCCCSFPAIPMVHYILFCGNDLHSKRSVVDHKSEGKVFWYTELPVISWRNWIYILVPFIFSIQAIYSRPGKTIDEWETNGRRKYAVQRSSLKMILPVNNTCSRQNKLATSFFQAVYVYLNFNNLQKCVGKSFKYHHHALKHATDTFKNIIYIFGINKT